MEISTLDLKRACNCSPFFNWTDNLDKDDIPRFCLRIDGTEQMFGPFCDQSKARPLAAGHFLSGVSLGDALAG